MKNNFLISMQGITKSYKEKKVLCGVDLDIGAGSCVGVLGKNGTGKSTLLKIMIGLIQPNSGLYKKNLDGKRVSALIETPNFLDNYSIKSNIEYLLEEDCIKSATSYLEAFGLSDYLEKKVKKLSLGMRQKLALSIVFAQDADVLLLDEPFNSLDFDASEQCIQIIKEICKAGKSVVIVTHNISRIDAYCDTIFVLEEGVLKSIPMSQMRSEDKYKIAFASEKGLRRALTLLGDYLVEILDKDSLLIKVLRENVPIITQRLASCEIVEVSEMDLRIEDIYRYKKCLEN